MRLVVAAIGLVVWLAGHTAQAAAPRVVVSIKPIHALVAAVMAEVGAPEVLIKGASSPHAYSLRPSDARLLTNADVVVWIGPMFENFLAAPLATMTANAEVVSVADMPDVRLLPARAGGVWEPHADDDASHTVAGVNLDGHLWLDPRNAEAIVRGIAAILDKRDPAHAAAYDANATQVLARLAALDAEIVSALAPVKPKPFIVFHDAYQYFQARYDLNTVGSITVSPDREPGARRIAGIRQKIASLGAVCLFAEPQFQPKLMTALIADTHARAGVLDPEGTTLSPGPELYFALMRGLTRDLVACLAQ